MNNEPLKIKKRGEDGNKVITVRIKEETLSALDKIDIFCIYLPSFYPLGVPLYAFGVKKRASCNLLDSLFAVLFLLLSLDSA